jgi:hypothetical protein
VNATSIERPDSLAHNGENIDLYSVLPGPDEATPPIERKFTANRRKHTANSNFFDTLKGHFHKNLEFYIL